MVVEKVAHRMVYGIGVLAAVFVHPIAWLPWLIEWLVRRRRPGWRLSAYTATPYFMVITLAATLVLLRCGTTVALIGVYAVAAMEVVAMWLCLVIAIGKPSPVQRLLRRYAQRRPPLAERKVLLGPGELYIGAISYVFTMYFFGYVSCWLYFLDTGAYIGVQVGSRLYTLWQFVYYSVVTITTLGYGDIQPKRFESQLLSVVEVMTGIFLVVFLFAAFVSYRVGQMRTLDDQ